MNVTDFVNLVINSLKITGKGTGTIKDNGDGTQSAVILTFKDPLDGDVFDFGNETTSNINDVKPQTKPSQGNSVQQTEQQTKPNHIVSMDDVNTNYYENAIKNQAEKEAQNNNNQTNNNNQSNSSTQSWFGSFIDKITEFINSIVSMLTGNATT